MAPFIPCLYLWFKLLGSKALSLKQICTLKKLLMKYKHHHCRPELGQFSLAVILTDYSELRL